ncbi:MAG: hypothetical protein KC516_00240 [Nanoarchaeota archaeon]|nr:hypothetical protein [Nanoarchaeota archaeon]
MLLKRGKRGQVTVFIIIAIIIIAIVGAYFLFRNTTRIGGSVPDFVSPIENSFLDCVNEKVLVGSRLLGSGAGYIYPTEFESGSTYMPFSSHLDFVGNEIPYWYYVSGGNIAKEQVPTKSFMEGELERYLSNQIKNCDFEEYSSQGYGVVRDLNGMNLDVKIDNSEIIVDIDLKLSISKGESSYVLEKHSKVVDSKLGELYDDAIELYNQEQKSLFLENYAVDFMRLYAPVDGVEISCSPMTWGAEKIFEDLKEGIEINTLSIKGEGTENDYFKVDSAVKNNFRFIYSKDWPYSFEVNPSEGSLLIADPVGNQQGLGILGFCYTTYHFVYNLAYPTLIQVYSGDEIFQFPVAVVIRGNLPREPAEGIAQQGNQIDICSDSFSKTSISVSDYQGSPVEASISYECSGNKCSIGETGVSNGSLIANLPQCVNGELIITADGYKDSSSIYSSVNEGSISIFLDKEYSKEIVLKKDGQVYNGNAIVTFNSLEDSQTILIPNSKEVVLSEGDYEIQISTYKNSSLSLAETTQEQCVDVPATGIGAFFGAKKQECFEITIPEQIVSQVLSGGGSTSYFISESELKNSNYVELNFESLPEVNSLDDLQNNYILYENKKVEVNFK